MVKEIARAENSVYAVTLGETEDSFKDIDARAGELPLEIVAEEAWKSATEVPVGGV
jgi:hypothetical protein